MDLLNVNLTDAAVIAVVILSGAFAFVRGFVREVLVVAAWIGAAFATLYSFSYLKPVLREYISSTLIADAATGLAIFIVTLVVLSLISHGIAARVRGSSVGALDRSLGFLFGLARGAVLVCIAYLVLTWFLPVSDQPAWIRDARVTPLVDQASAALLKLVPANTRGEGVTTADDLARKAGRLIRRERGVGEPTAVPKDDSGDGAGYGATQRKELDRLIRTRQGN